MSNVRARKALQIKMGRTSMLTGIVFIIGMLVRFIYTMSVDYTANNIITGGNYTEIIKWMIQNTIALPSGANSTWASYPVFYLLYGSVGWLLTRTGLTIETAIAALKWLSFILVMLASAFMITIARKLIGYKNGMLPIVSMLIMFNPLMMFQSTWLNPSPLVLMLASASILLLINWWRSCDLASITGAGILTGIMLATQPLSAMQFMIPVLIILILGCIMHRSLLHRTGVISAIVWLVIPFIFIGLIAPVCRHAIDNAPLFALPNTNGFVDNSDVVALTAASTPYYDSFMPFITGSDNVLIRNWKLLLSGGLNYDDRMLTMLGVMLLALSVFIIISLLVNASWRSIINSIKHDDNAYIVIIMMTIMALIPFNSGYAWLALLPVLVSSLLTISTPVDGSFRSRVLSGFVVCFMIVSILFALFIMRTDNTMLGWWLPSVSETSLFAV